MQLLEQVQQRGQVVRLAALRQQLGDARVLPQDPRPVLRDALPVPFVRRVGFQRQPQRRLRQPRALRAPTVPRFHASTTPSATQRRIGVIRAIRVIRVIGTIRIIRVIGTIGTIGTIIIIGVIRAHSATLSAKSVSSAARGSVASQSARHFVERGKRVAPLCVGCERNDVVEKHFDESQRDAQRENHRDPHRQNAAGERHCPRGVGFHAFHDVAQHPLEDEEQRGGDVGAGKHEANACAEQQMREEAEVQNERREAVVQDFPRGGTGRVRSARADDPEDVVQELRAAVVFEEGNARVGLRFEIDAKLAVLAGFEAKRPPFLDFGERAALGAELPEGDRVVVEVAVENVRVDPVLERDFDGNRGQRVGGEQADHLVEGLPGEVEAEEDEEEVLHVAEELLDPAGKRRSH